MYGLKEAGYLSNLELKRVLAKEGYLPSQFTPGLFTHKTRDIAFSLVVDDFGIKYTKKDAEHLIKTIMDRYEGKVSWDPDYYLGMTLEWDYIKRTCKLSMPEYVKQALCKFQHIMKQKCYCSITLYSSYLWQETTIDKNRYISTNINRR